MAKKPMKAANARGLNRETLADAKTNTAFKSMDTRSGKKNLSLIQQFGRQAEESKLFDAATKLVKQAKADRVAGARMGRAQSAAAAKKKPK